MALFFKCLLKIGVHVTGNCLDPVHPFQPDVVNEVVDYLLLLAILNPEDVSGFKINDVRSISVTVVEFKLINTKVFRLFLGLYKLAAIIGGVVILETLFINLLDCIFPESGNLSYLLVCISVIRWPSALKEINWLFVAPHLGQRS